MVALQDNAGQTYYYDDPSLGGNGNTAWTADELVEPDAEEQAQEIEKPNSGQTVLEKTERVRNNRSKSIVEVEDESGYVYYYDDPALGGTGKSAWRLEDFEENDNSAEAAPTSAP